MLGVAWKNFIFERRCGNINMIETHVSRMNTDFAAEEWAEK